MTRTSDVVPGSPLGERLHEALLAEKVGITALGEMVGASPGHIGRIIRGERWRETVDVELARRIAKRLRVNFAWLVIGEGPMRPGEEVAGVSIEKLEEFGARLTQLAKLAEQLASAPTAATDEKISRLIEQLDALAAANTSAADTKSRVRRRRGGDTGTSRE